MAEDLYSNLLPTAYARVFPYSDILLHEKGRITSKNIDFSDVEIQLKLNPELFEIESAVFSHHRSERKVVSRSFDAEFSSNEGSETIFIKGNIPPLHPFATTHPFRVSDVIINQKEHTADELLCFFMFQLTPNSIFPNLQSLSFDPGRGMTTDAEWVHLARPFAETLAFEVGDILLNVSPGHMFIAEYPDNGTIVKAIPSTFATHWATISKSDFQKVKDSVLAAIENLLVIMRFVENRVINWHRLDVVMFMPDELDEWRFASIQNHFQSIALGVDRRLSSVSHDFEEYQDDLVRLLKGYTRLSERDRTFFDRIVSQLVFSTDPEYQPVIRALILHTGLELCAKWLNKATNIDSRYSKSIVKLADRCKESGIEMMNLFDYLTYDQLQNKQGRLYLSDIRDKYVHSGNTSVDDIGKYHKDIRAARALIERVVLNRFGVTDHKSTLGTPRY